MEKQAKSGLKKAGKILAALLTVGIAAGIAIWLFPYVLSLKDEAVRAQFQAVISSLGVWGFFAMLAIQVLQVIIAIIPGEPVEILSGVLYGGFGGLFLCLLGILIGTAVIYFAVKKFGMPLVKKFVCEEQMSRFRFLSDAKRLEVVTFLLFFIPGTPKDVLTYLVPLTKIKPVRFFLIATFARIPSIITSSFVGENLSTGNLWGTVLIFGISGALGLGGILVNHFFLEKMNREEKQGSH